MRRFYSMCVFLAVAALLLSLAPAAQATNEYFKVTNGDYGTAGNWNTALPTYPNHGYIGGPGTYTATAFLTTDDINDGAGWTADLYLGTNATTNGGGSTGPGALTVNIGAGYTFLQGGTSTAIYDGYQANGTVLVSGGTMATASVFIGGATNAYNTATGSMQIDGAGTTWAWANGSPVYVGYYGSGSLLISNGAQNSTASGFTGNGILNVGYIGGSQTGSNPTVGAGTLQVHGGSSTLTINNGTTALNIGNGGNGTVTISNGGTLSAPNGGAVTLGVGSNSLNGITSATLQVLNGGTFSNSGTTTIGYYSYTSGTLTVDGSHSVWNDTGSALFVGSSATNSTYSGSGTLNITNGATVNATSATTYVGATAPGGAVNGLGTLNFGSSNGGTLNTGMLWLPPGSVTGAGTINAKGLGGSCNITDNSPAGAQASIGATTLNLASTLSVLYLGYDTSASSSLSISNGQTLTTGGSANPDVWLGYNQFGPVTATVSGAGSALNAGGRIILNGASMVVSKGASASASQGFYDGGSTLSSTATISNGASFTCNEPYTGWVAAGIGNYGGPGTLNVTSGSTFTTTEGPLSVGGFSGSSGQGTLNISGAGSKCTINADPSFPDGLLMNYNGGQGRVDIAGGGALTSNGQDVLAGTAYEVSIDGAGSTWTNTGSGIVVDNGAAVYISGGAAVSTPSLGVGAGASSTGSLLEIDAGRGSSLTVTNGGALSLGTGSSSNATLRLVAGAGALANTYTPISAGTWNSGTVAYQPVGGTWNSGTEQFTVSAPATSAPGTAVVNTAVNQRVLFTDASGNSLGASFLPTSGTLNVTATALAGSPEPSLGNGQFVSGDWGLSGVTASSANPVYLSLSTNPVFVSDAVWCYNGTAWSQVTGTNAPDLTFDGTYYSFDLTGSGGTGLGFAGYDYAVVGNALPGDANLDGRVDINDLTIVLANYNQTGMTWTQGEFTGDGTVDINDLTIVLANYNVTVGSSAGPGIGAVPEPAGLLLLAAGLAGLLAYAWRKRK